MGPLALGTPEPRGQSSLLPPQDPLQAQALHCTWALAHWQMQDETAMWTWNTGVPDLQEITVASQARGRWLPMKSPFAPTQLELFPSNLLALP